MSKSTDRLFSSIDCHTLPFIYKDLSGRQGNAFVRISLNLGSTQIRIELSNDLSSTKKQDNLFYMPITDHIRSQETIFLI
jgi:hypothetical protein